MYRNLYIFIKINIYYTVKKDDSQMAMIKKNSHIWIWIENGKILKAISCIDDGTVRIYNEHDQLILKRTGLSKFQVKNIEVCLQKYGAKRLSKQAKPFEFL
jgi:hypothetical protein